MARHRPERDVVQRCEALRAEYTGALETLSDADAVWRGEALGTLLWALQLAELPPYDTAFAPEELAVELAGAALRPAEEIELERETARLWHWRARTAELGAAQLPPQFASVDQLVASVAMRGYERGVLATPLRGDFRAFGKIYRHLSPAEQAEARSIAIERHHALSWLCGDGSTWDDASLDT